jgi:LacI family transcriptional regulator
MPRLRHIALVFDRSHTYGRGILEGIYDYAKDLPTWRLVMCEHSASGLRRALSAEHDGVIAFLNKTELMEIAAGAGRPVVNVSGALEPGSIPLVTTDNEQVGRLAARYLIDHGHRRLACYHRESPYGRQRAAGFIAEAAAHGVQVLELCGSKRLQQMRRLKALPRPLGLFVESDAEAVHVPRVLRSLRLRVPADVALLGVDADDFLCRICDPQLSSIRLPLHGIGQSAARILRDLMHGLPPPPGPIKLPPAGVHPRASVEMARVDDPDLAAALAFIRASVARPIGASDVCEAVATSRSGLERRFRLLLQRSPYEEIQRVRIARARDLLLETSTPVYQIARQCGFRSAERFCHAFRRSEGISPGAYRQAARENLVGRIV